MSSLLYGKLSFVTPRWPKIAWIRVPHESSHLLPLGNGIDLEIVGIGLAPALALLGLGPYLGAGGHLVKSMINPFQVVFQQSVDGF